MSNKKYANFYTDSKFKNINHNVHCCYCKNVRASLGLALTFM